MKKWLSEHYKSCIVITILLIPVVIAFCVSANWIRWPKIEGHNDWIGFWGSYTGAIIGGIITLIVLNKTLEENRNTKIGEEKREFFRKLIEDVTYMDIYPKRILNALTENTNKEYIKVVQEYNRRALEMKLRIEIEKSKKIYKGIDEVLDRLIENLEITDVLVKEKMVDTEEKRLELMRNIEKNKIAIQGLIFTIKKFIEKNV